MDHRDIRETLNQLVEAWDQQNNAREQLDDFRAAYSLPPTPDRFDTLQDFLKFHDSSQRYVERLRAHEEALASAGETYAAAAERLQGVLPENVPLHYVYQGGGWEREGWQYEIVRREDEVVILSAHDPGPSAI